MFRVGTRCRWTQVARLGGLVASSTTGIVEERGMGANGGEFHHRLTAVWLSGRGWLESGEYLLLEKDAWRPWFGARPLPELCHLRAEGE